MLHGFYRGSRLRQWLSRMDAPPVILQCRQILDKIWGLQPVETTISSDKKFQRQQCCADLRRIVRQNFVLEAHQIYYKGVSYTRTSFHQGNSLITFRNADGTWTPASIQHIILLAGEIQLVVKTLSPADEEENPFQAFPFFSAKIYSNTFNPEMELVLMSQVRGQYAMYALSNRLSAIVDLAAVMMSLACGDNFFSSTIHREIRSEDSKMRQR